MLPLSFSLTSLQMERNRQRWEKIFSFAGLIDDDWLYRRRGFNAAAPDPREVDALIERGYLEPNDRDDREALAAAVNACFSDALMTP
jgi:hypothetical protein